MTLTLWAHKPPVASVWCVTVDTSGRRTVRSGHYYQRRDGVWVCVNCGAVK